MRRPVRLDHPADPDGAAAAAAAAGGPLGTGDGSGTLLHRTGPGGSMPADHQFGVALTTLWHAVSEAGGTVGFVPGTPRSQVAPRAADVVDGVRRGRRQAVAVTRDRTLVAFGQLVPGTGLRAHTGEIGLLMVDPALQRSGLGSAVLTELLAVAGERGVERVELGVRDGHGLVEFYARYGFRELGRRPGWVRVAAGDDRDEVLLWAPVPVAGR